MCTGQIVFVLHNSRGGKFTVSPLLLDFYVHIVRAVVHTLKKAVVVTYRPHIS
jgi:hypothetical protein